MKKLLNYATAILTVSLAVSTANAQRPLGVDVSSYQGSINWTSVHGAGVQFAFAKATEGTFLHDSTYLANMNNGKAAGILMGAYEFSRPDVDTPAAEATYFWNFAGGKITADNKSLMPAIEFAIFNGHVGASSYTKWFNAWAGDVIADGQAAHVTLRPVIVVSCAAACNLTSGITLDGFLVNYNGQNLYTGTPACLCNPWGTWTYWQVSDMGSIPGISGNVDLDTFNGTYAQLKAAELVTPF